METLIDKISILSKLSALKEVSRIRRLFLEEEERLEELLENMLKDNDHTKLSVKELIKDFNSYKEILKAQKESMVK